MIRDTLLQLPMWLRLSIVTVLVITIGALVERVAL